MKDAPTTAAIGRILAGAAEVHVIDSPSVIDDPGADRIVVTGHDIVELGRLLAVHDGGVTDRCLCHGGPTIVVIGRERVTLSLHHRTRLRGPWRRDAELRDVPALVAWLADRGLTGPRDAEESLTRDEARREERRVRWVRAAPKLVYLADPVSRGEDGAERRLAASLPKVYPDRGTRIRELIAWAGFPPRWRNGEHADGTPWHELAPQRMLLAEPPSAVLDALLSAPLSPEQLDGAADLVTSHGWSTPLPEALRAQLIAHVTSTGTEPMKFRMRHGYGGGRTP